MINGPAAPGRPGLPPGVSMTRLALFGLGLRKPHYGAFIDGDAPQPVDFLEVISENFMVAGGRPRDVLRRVRARHALALHGVSMSLGSAEGVDRTYLHRLRALVDEVDPMFVSDHLSWSRTGGFNAHDLLPLPYTEEALDVTCDNVGRAQDALGRVILVENPSSYLTFAGDMTEWEFLAALCQRTGCALLLDVNNVFVSASNHGFDPGAYLDGLPMDRVRQIHLAGHSKGAELLIDTHDHPVADAVWSLYVDALAQVGDVAVMIERDDAIPPLSDLLDELAVARRLEAGGVRRAA